MKLLQSLSYVLVKRNSILSVYYIIGPFTFFNNSKSSLFVQTNGCTLPVFLCLLGQTMLTFSFLGVVRNTFFFKEMD